MRRMRTRTKGGSCGGTCPAMMGGKRSTKRNKQIRKRRVTRKRKGGTCGCAKFTQPMAF